MPALLNRLSHIGFHIPEGQQLASTLMCKFGFEPLAERVTKWCRQLACRRGTAVFVINERLKSVREEVTPVFSSSHCKDKEVLYDVDPQYAVGTASNICFETEDVSGISQSLQERGCQILIPPTNIEDENGCVTYTVVRSVLGNISHTLLDRSQYRGPFLPGFHTVQGLPKETQGSKITHFDHITYVCSKGSSQAVLDWYKNCFGFQRFHIHQQDDVAEGYRIQGDGVGLRLTGMQYSGSGLKQLDHNCKFVLAESLPDQSKNQVDTFLEQHGGAGIQHVALYTADIIGTASAMANSGANFFKPPLAYYSEKSKEQEIQQVGQDPQLLKNYGILLDAEVGRGGVKRGPGLHGKPYLMQIFTKPLFPEETFFLELIERCGATGFGERNVRALWQSVQNYMDKKY